MRKKEIKIGYTPLFHCHTSSFSATLVEIIKKLDLKTSPSKEDPPIKILRGQNFVLAKFRPKTDIFLEINTSKMSRILVSEMKKIIGFGQVIDVEI